MNPFSTQVCINMTNQQIVLCYRQQQFHKYAESIVKSTVTIESENPKIDVVAGQCSFEHREADDNTFKREISVIKIKL